MLLYFLLHYLSDEEDEKEVEIKQDIVKKSRCLQGYTRFSDRRGKNNFRSCNFPFQQFSYQVMLWRIFCQTKSFSTSLLWLILGPGAARLILFSRKIMYVNIYREEKSHQDFSFQNNFELSLAQLSLVQQYFGYVFLLQASHRTTDNCTSIVKDDKQNLTNAFGYITALQETTEQMGFTKSPV